VCDTGTSYQEYSLLDKFTRRYTVYFGCCPEPYSMLVFRLIFTRPKLYYFWQVEFPGVMLTLLSFAVFWLVRVAAHRLQSAISAHPQTHPWLTCTHQHTCMCARPGQRPPRLTSSANGLT
jgi:hypothetical protein